MFHRWSEVLIRRARLVLALGVLATVLAGVFGVGVFDSLGQGGFDDPSSEAARELGPASRRCSATSRSTWSPSTAARTSSVTDPAFKAEVDETLAAHPGRDHHVGGRRSGTPRTPRW